MPLGPGWLNAWVKVNSKHVVLTPNKKVDKDSHHGARDETLHPSSSKAHTTANSSTATGPTSATASGTATQDPENQAIRRFNSRKHKRRLQRTVSASDLLRDKAKEKGAAPAKQESLESEAQVSPNATASASDLSETDKGQNAAVRLAQHDENESIVSAVTDSSLRFVAGFFGADIERYSSGSGHPDAAASTRASPHPQQFKDGGNCVYEAASVHLLERSKSPLDAASIASRGVQSVPPRAYSSGGLLPRTDSNVESRSQGGGSIAGIRFPPSLFAGGDTNNNHSKGHCRHCKELENNLLSAQEDLEYLRGLTLQREYVCQGCLSQSRSSKRGDQASFHSREAVLDGAQMLNEVTARHKSQIEQITKERARWQQDAHFKLQKFANLCKDLNEEAALRNEEALFLHQELGVIRSERDEMATEIEKLKAQLAIQERREQEHRKAEETLKQYEQKGLNGADKAIQTRGAIIIDLAGRLELALDTLDVEREQQRQRRQIIFPTARASNTDIGDELESELKETKEALRESLSAMESMRHDSQMNEIAWKVRNESLERQLDAARSQ